MAERQLVASTSAAVPAALLQAAAAASGFDAATALVATCAPTAASLPGAPFDAVCVLSPAGEVRAGTVAWAVKMLVKKGRLSLLQPAAQVRARPAARRRAEPVAELAPRRPREAGAASQGSARSAALFNGLVGLDSREVDLLGARFALTAGAAPAVEVGAKSAIRLSGAPAAAPAVWKIDAAEDSELIDEDALLTEDDLKPVAPPAQGAADLPSQHTWCCRRTWEPR